MTVGGHVERYRLARRPRDGGHAPTREARAIAGDLWRTTATAMRGSSPGTATKGGAAMPRTIQHIWNGGRLRSINEFRIILYVTPETSRATCSTSVRSRSVAPPVARPTSWKHPRCTTRAASEWYSLPPRKARGAGWSDQKNTQSTYVKRHKTAKKCEKHPKLHC